MMDRLLHPFQVPGHVLVWGGVLVALFVVGCYGLGYLHGRAAGKAAFLRSALPDLPARKRAWPSDVLVGVIVVAVVVGTLILLTTFAAPPFDPDAPAGPSAPDTHPWQPLRPRHGPGAGPGMGS